MDWFSYLASGVGVYVAVAVFTLGMAWRVWQWSRTPKSAVRLGLFPKSAIWAIALRPSGRMRWKRGKTWGISFHSR